MSQNPGLERRAYPGCRAVENHNPEGVVLETSIPRLAFVPDTTPVGVANIWGDLPRGSSFLATPGCGTQSQRDYVNQPWVHSQSLRWVHPKTSNKPQRGSLGFDHLGRTFPIAER